MLDTTAIDTWLAGYLKAWGSDAPEDITAIFEPGARYYTTPYRPPHEGHEAIVSMWVGRKNTTIAWSFDYQVLAREGALHVIEGVTTYPDGIDNPGAEIYDNLWLVTLADSGRE